jgi:hypothetical protein
MENKIHKGSELNNVRETWDQNERLRASGNTAETESATTSDATIGTDLEQLIKKEASEYDNENKENRVLTGDRATVNDEGSKE